MTRPSPELLALINGEPLNSEPSTDPINQSSSSYRRTESSNSDQSENPAMRAARAVIQNERTQTFGYSNNFHSTSISAEQDGHATSALDKALAARSKFFPPSTIPHPSFDILPSYNCTVHFEGPLALRRELASPFMQASAAAWIPVYAILHGTALHLYRHKPQRAKNSPEFDGRIHPKHASTLSEHPNPEAGSLLRSFSLQHAELGLALDYRPVVPPPISSLVKMQLLFAPAAKCAQILTEQYREHPERFEPLREHVFRVRAESEQFLLSADSELEMLGWVETMCRSVDISLPLEGRSEPRGRTLPRRGRRMRLLEGDVESVAAAAVRGAGNDGFARRLVVQQERLFREMYPHLARTSSGPNAAAMEEQEDAVPHAEGDTHHEVDPDAEDLDASDVRLTPSTNTIAATTPDSSDHRRSTSLTTSMTSQHPSTTSLSATFPNSIPVSRTTTTSEKSPRSPPSERPNTHPTPRYLRRCAPILFAHSPRACNVLLYRGRRMKVNTRRGCLEIWEPNPGKHSRVGTDPEDAKEIVGELPPGYEVLYGATNPHPAQPERRQQPRPRPTLRRNEESEQSVGGDSINAEPEHDGGAHPDSPLIDGVDEIVPLRAVTSEASAKGGMAGKGKGQPFSKAGKQMRKHAKAEAKKAKRAKGVEGGAMAYSGMGSMGYGVVG
ncbi:hypothetical protein P152DRAFT_471574 [Eremomyces bilateralis CBS 781.70]|uniref:PH domain-containing protein n=1 Tax=Eremomyces bilateralis CBS 781.70 TaxID=1392243 RepID=A0A6G1GAF2_9PEZI|nr:uncharacterized protein P152DRAFT_471574 [Eremomyces bilateralis CBS 781.70]KAF1814916.1 hypothetical protein P152DRAFT_471574 [Eremomyces bilateralis CBS 781.70]